MGANINISVKLGRLHLASPIIISSGIVSFDSKLLDIIELSSIGAIILKGTTFMPKKGNPSPRIVETEGGIINSIGLQNPGIEKVIEILPQIKEKYKVPLIANIAGETMKEYGILAEKFTNTKKVDAIEINLSCPNVKKGGQKFATPRGIKQIIKIVKENTTLPIIAKLPPMIWEHEKFVNAAIEGGVEIISLINTLNATAIDIYKQRFVLGNRTGGLSGPAIKPFALYNIMKIFEICKISNIPIIGEGGISKPEDLIEFFLAGASACCIGTILFKYPNISSKMIDFLKEYMSRYNINCIKSMVGKVYNSNV